MCFPSLIFLKSASRWQELQAPRTLEPPLLLPPPPLFSQLPQHQNPDLAVSGNECAILNFWNLYPWSQGWPYDLSGQWTMRRSGVSLPRRSFKNQYDLPPFLHNAPNYHGYTAETDCNRQSPLLDEMGCVAWAREDSKIWVCYGVYRGVILTRTYHVCQSDSDYEGHLPWWNSLEINDKFFLTVCKMGQRLPASRPPFRPLSSSPLWPRDTYSFSNSQICQFPLSRC